MANLWGSMNSQQAVNMGLGFLQNTMAMQQQKIQMEQQKMQMEQQKQAMQMEQQRIKFLRNMEMAKFKNDSARLKLEQDKAINEQNKLKFLLDQIKAETERTQAQTGQIIVQTKTIEPESKAKIKATEALGTQREAAATKNLSEVQPEEIFNKKVKEKEKQILANERTKPQDQRINYTAEQLRIEAIRQLKRDEFYAKRKYYPIKGTRSTEPKGLFGNAGALIKSPWRNPWPAWKSLFTTGTFKGKNTTNNDLNSQIIEGPPMPNDLILNSYKVRARNKFINSLVKEGLSEKEALEKAKEVKELW